MNLRGRSLTDQSQPWGAAIYELLIFESIAGSPGAVTIPPGATIRLDAWSAGVDALISTLSGGRPDFRNAVDAGGNAVTTTLDAAGNYALSAAPAGGYPVALIYVVRVSLASYLTWSAANLNSVIVTNELQDLPTPTAGDMVYANAEPRWVALAHPGGAESIVESTAASVQWATTTADGETNPSTVLRADANGDLRLRRIGLGVAPSYRIEATETFATTGLANTQAALIDSTVTGDGSGGSATHQALVLDLDDDTTGDAVNYTYVQPFYLYLNTVAGNRKRAYAQRITVDSTAGGTGSQVYGSYILITHSANAGTLPTLGGVLSAVTLDTAGATVTDVYGAVGQPFVSANVTTSKITGVYANTTITNGSHTELHLFEGRLYFATGTLGTFRGLDLTDFTHASGTITTGVGVDIGEVPGTTAYGLRSAVTAGANQYNLYISGTADNYLAGDLGIGSATLGAKLHVTGTSDQIQQIVRANGTQTANLQEWQASGGGILSQISATGLIGAPNGSAAAPSITFVNDPDCGFYSGGANRFAVSAANFFIAEFRNDGTYKHFRVYGDGSASINSDLLRLSDGNMTGSHIVNDTSNYYHIEAWLTGTSYDYPIALNALGGNVGVGLLAPAAKLHVDQSSATGAIPVLTLDQADLSEEFIEFTTTVGAGNPIDTAALGAYYGKARVNVTGVGYKYMALYDS